MNSRNTLRHLLAAVLVGVLVGGGLMATTPAGAEMASAAATNWKKIWKKKLQPHADKRYYKKSESDAKYSTKTETSAGLGNVYSKADADARYQPKGSYAPAGSSYSKAESDARYPRSTALVRGNLLLLQMSSGAGQYIGDDISFGTTFSAAPVVRLIPLGGPVPTGCSGSATAPDAAPGYLCVFTSHSANASVMTACPGGTAICANTADRWGATVFVTSTGAGLTEVFASWAARPSAVTTTALRPAPEPSPDSGARGVR